MNRMNAISVLEALTDGREYALLDVRERSRYAAAHLLLAINLPASRLELGIRRYVPRMNSRVILCDGGEGTAERVAGLLEADGYTDVAILDGGVPAWQEAGFEIFQGHYSMTYAFGMYVDRHYATPHISAPELKAKLDAGEDVVLLDGRPLGEVAHGTIPGARSVPFTELAYRLQDLVPDDNTPVVVNCGAVTRGILGTETLRDAGIANPIKVLTNGVRGWDFAGLDAEYDCDRDVPDCTDPARRWGKEAATRVDARSPIPRVKPEQLQQWHREEEQRTVFEIDIRTPAEYRAGHLPGSLSIAGSEIIGLYEDHIGTMNARVCLVDDDESRAIVTASWLKRIGWPDVWVLEGGLGGHELETGPESSSVLTLPADEAPSVPAETLATLIEGDRVAVIDFSSSTAYEAGHIPGAWWTSRAYLAASAPLLPRVEHYVVTSDDSRLSRFAAADLIALGWGPVSVLSAGNEGWRQTGRALVRGRTRILGPVEDIPQAFLFRPDDDRATRRAANRRTQEWQDALLEKIERDQTFSFPVLQSRGAH